ncbi:hypothetical protein PAXINDRAFT_98693 [Paxillus involutus ATCC 200175]|nr:hypothetical protein PAXINDRAFT_98693 [Paxillus involutus ATCC 200175]
MAFRTEAFAEQNGNCFGRVQGTMLYSDRTPMRKDGWEADASTPSEAMSGGTG